MAGHANPKGRYLRTHLRHLPLADNAFDLVYARDSVIHAPDPLLVLSELRRVASTTLLRVRIAEMDSIVTAHYRTNGGPAAIVDDTRHNLLGAAWQQLGDSRDYLSTTPTPPFPMA